MQGRVSGWKIFVISFFTSLAVCVIVSPILYLYVIPNLVSEKKVEVPNLHNLPAEQAKSLLKLSKLLYIISREEEHETIPEGNVISQEPLPGSLVPINSAVKIVVSKGIKKLPLPNLIGKDESAARSILLSQGITNITTERVYSKSVEKDKVVETIPPAGTEVAKTTEVKLIVSSGQQQPPAIDKVVVPDVIGKPLSNATAIIINKGLQIGEISKETSEDFEFGVVLRQTPKPGTTVNKGTKVNLVVNTEEEEESQTSPK
jgi:serine/threonine-protein kinase